MKKRTKISEPGQSNRFLIARRSVVFPILPCPRITNFIDLQDSLDRFISWRKLRMMLSSVMFGGTLSRCILPNFISLQSWLRRRYLLTRASSLLPPVRVMLPAKQVGIDTDDTVNRNKCKHIDKYNFPTYILWGKYPISHAINDLFVLINSNHAVWVVSDSALWTN